jgi:hypothetical protein
MEFMYNPSCSSEEYVTRIYYGRLFIVVVCSHALHIHELDF